MCSSGCFCCCPGFSHHRLVSHSPATKTRVSCHTGTAVRNALFAGRLSSITFLPSSVSKKQQRVANGTRISPLQRCKKNSQAWPYMHFTTPETLFEGVSPPTAGFLLMTHKIPHESDTICLIKPAAKMKLYIWCSKKMGREEKKPKHKTNKINLY